VAILDVMVSGISVTTCIPCPAKTEDTPNTPSLAYGASLGAFAVWCRGPRGPRCSSPNLPKRCSVGKTTNMNLFYRVSLERVIRNLRFFFFGCRTELRMHLRCASWKSILWEGHQKLHQTSL
jgi:hypothetical protein